MKSFLFTLLIAITTSCTVHAQEKITWMILDWPPWMIIDGEDSGDGRFNHILALAQENLPEYEHVTERMNWARFWHEIENNTNICYPFGLKTGNREEIAYYSAPHTFVLPNAVITTKARARLLGDLKSISIIELLGDTTLTGYAEKNRSFTSTIDSLLSDHEPGSNLKRVAESPESLIKMVLSERIDYTIEYPIVASYHQKNLGRSGELVSIPITEMDPYSYVYMNCTRNEWGKQVIEKWNKVLKTLKPTEAYRSITEIGHTDERELALIRSYYDTFINADQ